MAQPLDRLARYWRLPRDERRAFVRAALAMAVARFLVRGAGVPSTKRTVRRIAPRSPLPAPRLIHLVGAAAAALPGTTPCLARAIVLEAFLLRAGHAAELRIGLAPRLKRDRVEAHAWVEIDGVALEPGPSRYVAVPIFGARG